MRPGHVIIPICFAALVGMPLLLAPRRTASADTARLIIITPHIIRTSRDLEGYYKDKRASLERTMEESPLVSEWGMGLVVERLEIKPEEMIRDEGIRE